MAGRGLWAAGAFGVRAITNAAALELREHGIQVALLIVDAGIEPIGGGGVRASRPSSWPIRTTSPVGLPFLAGQGPRAASHELQITPLAERWVP